MNLRQAQESGRPWKRPHWKYWYRVIGKPDAAGDRYPRAVDDEYHSLRLSFDDAMADDYVVLEPEVTITRAQFEKAMDTVLGGFNDNGEPIARCALLALAHRLGLDP